jgi:hypothetical protein
MPSCSHRITGTDGWADEVAEIYISFDSDGVAVWGVG